VENELEQYKGALSLLTTFGSVGTEMADFIKTYGMELSAVQLGVKKVTLRKWLSAMEDMSGITKTLKELTLRHGGQIIPMTEVQRKNFHTLLGHVCEWVTTAGLARRLGMTRQSLYHNMRTQGPKYVTPLVMGMAGLLGFDSTTSFLSSLAAGVPDYKHLKRPPPQHRKAL